jgi:hypothetical protein
VHYEVRAPERDVDRAGGRSHHEHIVTRRGHRPGEAHPRETQRDHEPPATYSADEVPEGLLMLPSLPGGTGPLLLVLAPCGPPGRREIAKAVRGELAKGHHDARTRLGPRRDQGPERPGAEGAKSGEARMRKRLRTSASWRSF